MATIQQVEASVEAVVTLRRAADGTIRIIANGRSLNAAGTVVRATPEVEITSDVSAATRTGADNLLTNVENRLKTQWEIP